MALKAFRSFMIWPLPTSDFIICHAPATMAILLMLQHAHLFLPQGLYTCYYFCLEFSSARHWLVPLSHSDLNSPQIGMSHLYVTLHSPLPQALKLPSLLRVSNYHYLKFLFTCSSSPIEYKLHKKRDFICLVHHILLLLKIMLGTQQALCC